MPLKTHKRKALHFDKIETEKQLKEPSIDFVEVSRLEIKFPQER